MSVLVGSLNDVWDNMDDMHESVNTYIQNSNLNAVNDVVVKRLEELEQKSPDWLSFRSGNLLNCTNNINVTGGSSVGSCVEGHSAYENPQKHAANLVWGRSEKDEQRMKLPCLWGSCAEPIADRAVLGCIRSTEDDPTRLRDLLSLSDEDEIIGHPIIEHYGSIAANSELQPHLKYFAYSPDGVASVTVRYADGTFNTRRWLLEYKCPFVSDYYTQIPVSYRAQITLGVGMLLEKGLITENFCQFCIWCAGRGIRIESYRFDEELYAELLSGTRNFYKNVYVPNLMLSKGFVKDGTTFYIDSRSIVTWKSN